MSQVPVEELLDRVQQHLDAREGASPEKDAPRRRGLFSETVYERLEEASVVMESVYVRPFLTPPHLPLIGSLWQKVRAAAHDLVVFYVNRLAGVQAAFNREIVGFLTALVDDLDPGGRIDLRNEIAMLRDEIRALRAQVEALEGTGVARDASRE